MIKNILTFRWGYTFYGLCYVIAVSEVCDSYKCNFTSLENENVPVVQTPNGAISGQYVEVLNSSVITFFGIPYAKPPIGNKRFAKPEPIKRWHGLRYANRKPPACIQYSSRKFFWSYFETEQSEDCLYLNIWIPVQNDYCIPRGLPVMIFIHGGGFWSGSSRIEDYDAAILSSFGNIIVVNLNYRLGIFGFFHSGTSDAPGNVGMLDQILAIKWVKENIHEFGGDPNEITLAGESVGSISVGLHTMSPLSKGLFQRAIMQSITAISPYYIENSKSMMLKSSKISEDVGCFNEKFDLEYSPYAIIDCLRAKNATELAKAEDFYTSKNPKYFAPYFGSGCSDCVKFLPESPIKLLLANQFTQVPTIMGATGNEGTLYLAYLKPDIFPLDKKPNLTLSLVRDIAATLIPQLSEKASREIFDHYLRDLHSSSSDDVLKAVESAYGDVVVYCPTLFTAEKTKVPYLYLMTYRSLKDKNAEWVGVPHISDIQYIFGKPFLNDQKYTAEDRRFSDDLIEKWANFIKYGFPFNERSDRIWPKFSPTVPLLTYELNIRREGLIPFPRQQFCEFLRPYIYGDIS